MEWNRRPEGHQPKGGEDAQDGAGKEEKEKDDKSGAGDGATRGRLGNTCNAGGHQTEDKRDERHAQGTQPHLAKLAEGLSGGDPASAKMARQHSTGDGKHDCGEQSPGLCFAGAAGSRRGGGEWRGNFRLDLQRVSPRDLKECCRQDILLRTMTVTLQPAKEIDLAAIIALMNAAYRGVKSERSWCTEAAYITGKRMDESLLSE